MKSVICVLCQGLWPHIRTPRFLVFKEVPKTAKVHKEHCLCIKDTTSEKIITELFAQRIASSQLMSGTISQNPFPLHLVKLRNRIFIGYILHTIVVIHIRLALHIKPAPN